jgi:hypothetical protein
MGHLDPIGYEYDLSPGVDRVLMLRRGVQGAFAGGPNAPTPHDVLQWIAASK